MWKGMVILLLVLGVASCAPEVRKVGEVGEFVPGTKRWSGSYKRISKPVEREKNILGAPDVTITVDVYTSAFRPNVIRVKQNQVVKLILKSADDGDLPKITGLKEFSGHGFLLLGPYDIWITGLRAGVTKEVIFKATVPGEFEFECTVFCSLYHYKMRGKLIVEAL